MRVNALVEGPLDEAVASRILRAAKHELQYCWGKHGVAFVRENVARYASSAHGTPLLVLVDHVDTGLGCPPQVVTSWLPRRRTGLIFRVVVREIESWLMADRKNLAEFLRVPIGWIPLRPEDEDDPKKRLIAIARRSRSITIREKIAPRPDSTAQVGPLYLSEMQTFVQNLWNPRNVGERIAPSLTRCLERLCELKA